MHQSSFQLRLVVAIAFSLIISAGIPDLAVMQENETCYATFDDFAYRAPLLDRERMQQSLLPSWDVVATLPTYVNEIIGRHVTSVATRSLESSTEIWLRVFSSFSSPQQTDQFLIYHIETQQWEPIPAQVGNTSVFVEQLFVTRDERIWGKTNWNPRQENGVIERVPVLALFDEQTRSFNFADGVLEIPFLSSVFYSNPTQAVLGSDNIFWLFGAYGAIYRYDSISRRMERETDLWSLPATDAPDLRIIRDVALAPDGSIYFETESSALQAPFYRIKNNTLFRYVLGESSVQPIDSPIQEWPIFSGLLVDQGSRLWLGSTGYRNSDGNWQLLHPESAAFFELVDEGNFSYLWSPANLFFESSDGRLWFNRFLDTGGWAEGTAWYDPQSGEGCMITNQYSTVIEDNQQRLWLVAGGSLYRSNVNAGE